MTKTNMTVARQIQNQIGNRAFFMRGSKTVTHVRVALEAMDTYAVEFFKCRGTKVATVATFDGLHAEQLNATMATQTGLALSL